MFIYLINYLLFSFSYLAVYIVQLFLKCYFFIPSDSDWTFVLFSWWFLPIKGNAFKFLLSIIN